MIDNEINYENPALLSEPATKTTADRVNRVAQSAHAAVDRIAEKAIPAVERLRGGVHSASTTLRTRAEDLNGMQKRWVESSRGYVRHHPLVSVGAAVAAGMVLSRLIGRRH